MCEPVCKGVVEIAVLFICAIMFAYSRISKNTQNNKTSAQQANFIYENSGSKTQIFIGLEKNVIENSSHITKGIPKLHSDVQQYTV